MHVVVTANKLAGFSATSSKKKTHRICDMLNCEDVPLMLQFEYSEFFTKGEL